MAHCFCMCGGGALLGGLLWVSRSVECKSCRSSLTTGFCGACLSCMLFMVSADGLLLKQFYYVSPLNRDVLNALCAAYGAEA